MNKEPFPKKALTFPAQVNLLRSRGMVVDDEAEAEFYLRHLNYYRLSAYWLPFEADHATHCFKPETNFRQVLNLYVFDRELRLLVIDALERLEVSVRTQWAYSPANEQTEIAAFLENEIAKLDTLTAETQRAIDLLQERRTALISAAVTGQIDVRGEAHVNQENHFVGIDDMITIGKGGQRPEDHFVDITEMVGIGNGAGSVQIRAEFDFHAADLK